MNRSLALVAALLSLAACSGGGKGEPPPPPSSLYAAKTVIGQGAFDAPHGVATCGPTSLYSPTGSVAGDATRLLVPDTFSARILGFQPPPGAGAGAAAGWAIGDSTGTTTLDACDGVATFWTPYSLSLSGTTLVVADPGMDQVYLYDPVPTDSGEAAVPVPVGTPDDTASGVLDPQGAILVGGKLIVADTGHHRVLVWDPAPSDPLAATPAANLVLGQAAFTDGGGLPLVAENDTDADGVPGKTLPGPSYDMSPTGAVMSSPKAVWSDGTRLVVADSGNNRLLVWNTLPTASGAAADLVVGQAGFTTNAAAAGAAGLALPSSIASDGARLFVADTDNNRVVVYGTFPAASGAAATAVIGQHDLGGSAANDDDGDGYPDAAPSAGSLWGPTGVAVIQGRLFVTDTNNWRVLAFDPPTP